MKIFFFSSRHNFQMKSYGNLKALYKRGNPVQTYKQKFRLSNKMIKQKKEKKRDYVVFLTLLGFHLKFC